jgi:dienelactone hydrolase
VRNRALLAALLLLPASACSRPAGTGSGTAPATDHDATLGASTPARAATADLEVKGRVMVQWMARGEFNRFPAELDETMTKALPGDKLEGIWKDLVKKEGYYRETKGTRVQRRGQYQVVIVTCHFDHADLDVQLTFDPRARLAGLHFTPAADPKGPSYADTNAFTEADVTVGSGEWAVPGKLARPRGAGPFPAVVLLAGSGPQDHDETIGANKPLRDLAWGLASRGVVTLRYDKRTFTHGQRLVRDKVPVTLKEEVVDDALAAVALLRGQEGVDPARVFVLGHSLGAVAAPQVAERDPRVAGVVLLAGNTRPLEDVTLDQLTYLASLKGKHSRAELAQLDELKRQVARLKDRRSPPAADEVILGAPASYWLALRQYDPAAAAAKLPQPVLVLQGERDYQVSMADFAGWQKALAGKANARCKSYPGLNHLFIEGRGRSTPEEYGKAGHVAAEVVADVAAWVKGG